MGTYPKKIKTYFPTKTYTQMCIAALFGIVLKCRTVQMSFRWMRRETGNTSNVIPLSNKKEWNIDAKKTDESLGNYAKWEKPA